MTERNPNCLHCDIMQIVDKYMKTGITYNDAINSVTAVIAEIVAAVKPNDSQIESMADDIRDALARDVHKKILSATPVHGHA